MKLKTGVTRVLINITVWVNTRNNYLYTAVIDKCGCTSKFVLPIYQIIISYSSKIKAKIILQFKIHKCTDNILDLNEKYPQIIITEICILF